MYNFDVYIYNLPAPAQTTTYHPLPLVQKDVHIQGRAQMRNKMRIKCTNNCKYFILIQFKKIIYAGGLNASKISSFQFP